MEEEDEDQWNAQRKRKKFSKESQIYGAFWSSDEEEENTKPTKNFSKPMGFVSAGEPIEKEEDDYKPTMGLGGARMGLGSKKQKVEDEPKKNTFGMKSFRYSGRERNSLQGEPDFEQHTKGIGSKLMKGMGWTPGEGLGREKQGINRPIEVKVRPKTQGLGFDGFKERTDQQMEDFPTEGDLEDREKEGVEEIRGPREKGWKRKAAKQKKVYRLPTAMDAKPEPAQKLVIKDMRGEEVRILSNVNDIYADEGTSSEYMPELQHNLRLLANLREADILNIDRKMNSSRDRLVKLKDQTESLSRTVQAEADQIGRLKEIMKIIAQCQEKIQTKSMSLESLAKVFLLFQKRFSEEYQQHQLYLLASPMVQPLLKHQLDSWKPLQNPEFAMEELLKWKHLTEPQLKDKEEDDDLSVGKRQQTVDVYTQLICDLVLPKFRSALTNEWKVRDPEPPLKLIEKWRELFPPEVLENILDQLVFPRLHHEVDNWNPRADTVPIHQWLHPWLQLLGDRLKSFYPSIRHKLGLVLQDWKAIDTSAHIIISPWKGVFDSQSMKLLLEKSILPNLGALMHAFVINPGHQDLAPFKAFTIWEDVVPMQALVDILEQSFFPKYHQVLFTWLSRSPNFQEVSAWYTGWKDQFSAAMLADERVRNQFNRALQAMSTALAGGRLVNQAFVPPTPIAATTPLPSIPKPAPTTLHADEMTFRQLVEQEADKAGLLLMPTGKRHEGKVIFNFGNIPVILGKEELHRLDKGKWKPVSFEELVALNS